MVWKDTPHIEHVEVDSSIAAAVGVDSHLAEAGSDYCKSPVHSLPDAKVYDVVSHSRDAVRGLAVDLDHQRLGTMKVVVGVDSLVVDYYTVDFVVDTAAGVADSDSGVDSVNRRRGVWSRS